MALVLTLVAATLAAPALCVGPIATTTIAAPITIPFDTSLRTNSTYLPLQSASLPDANAPASQPTQVHLSPAGVNSVTVSWATQNYTVGKGYVAPLPTAGVVSLVQYGASPTALTSTASGITETYNQIYNTTVSPRVGGDNAFNYTSPLLHSVVVANLSPGATYFYRVGDGTTFSGTFNFTALKAPGQNYPQRIIAIADWGLSSNSSSTLDHVLDSVASSTSPPLVNYIADFVYADCWYVNGTVSIPTQGFEGALSSTWQPVWDSWQRFIQPLVSQVPMLFSTGNHEIEQQSTGEIFRSVMTRWKAPASAIPPPAPASSFFFYSHEVGPIHNIFLSPYVDYTPGSDQWNWLAYDLLRTNRTVTPWVIVNIHNPWVTTDSSYKEFEQMRTSMEPLTYQFGVDIFFYGHVHAYERSAPVYNYEVNPCGSVHITIGDAGNSEGLSFLLNYGPAEQFEDLNGGCGNVTYPNQRASYLNTATPNIIDPFTYYRHVLTFQADGNSTGYAGEYPKGYCYAEQPLWSQYREPSFGHGTLDALNATHARWQWHRNQDGVKVAAEDIYVIRDTTACPNKAGQGLVSGGGASD
ncbi:hypothetical protein WJX74_006451 [Apatococcus lobatus]|uniref:Purple acid phosphatase n=2 Tax=Apatococcus TaxID=904362 RepID=A0AAW1T631_9CHLO